MSKILVKRLLFVALFSNTSDLHASTEIVQGRNFKVPALQKIKFVPIKEIAPALFRDLPRDLDLKNFQSQIKNQGPRGACTYFATTSLVESLIIKVTGKELDLSEEYLAWAAKTKTKMRSMEEDSSVAVNLVTLENFGLMLEEDLPYQPSWFEKGMPCEGKNGNSNADPICYSHSGPSEEKLKTVFRPPNLIFEAVNSSSLDLVKALVRKNSPVHLSILGHREMWSQITKGGELYLTRKWKEDCRKNSGMCSGHAVLVVGYDLNKKLFMFKNSWGTEWGHGGYGTIPFDYIDQMSPRKLFTGYIVGRFNHPKHELSRLELTVRAYPY